MIRYRFSPVMIGTELGSHLYSLAVPVFRCRKRQAARRPAALDAEQIACLQRQAARSPAGFQCRLGNRQRSCDTGALHIRYCERSDPGDKFGVRHCFTSFPTILNAPPCQTACAYPCYDVYGSELHLIRTQTAPEQMHRHCFNNPLYSLPLKYAKDNNQQNKQHQYGSR